MTTATEYKVHLRRPHPKQQGFVDSVAKRIIIRAGRRSGKTTGIAIKALQRFLAGGRVLYATPTQEQIGRFWFEVKRSLTPLIESRLVYINETMHLVEFPGTENRIKAKTAFNADTLRGDYADLLILDEWQLMNEDAWELVGAPMLLDNNGDAVFIYTPPSLHSRSVSKARDKRHATKLFERARHDPRWEVYHFTSYDNPHISRDALEEIARDMTRLAYRQEIEAEDVDEAPGALWKLAIIESNRVSQAPDLRRIVIALDPSGGHTEAHDEVGIIVAGLGADGHGYVIADASGRYSPDAWARQAVDLYDSLRADRIVAEHNFGGEMVEHTLRTVRSSVPYKALHASRGKQARAEPVAALYEQGRVHHVGVYPQLEDEMCTWEPAASSVSPNRMDALVWALTELLVQGGAPNIRFL